MAAIDDEHSSPRKLPSIRRALLWLGIACTVPTILVASAAAYEDYLLRKERVYETAVSMARTLVAELERELRGVESGLRILATSEELQQGKLGAFHRRLQDALQLQNVDGYVLLDNHDMLVANSSAPYPSPDQKRPAGRDPAAGPIAAGRRHEPVQHRPARRADHRRRDSGDPARPGPVRPVRRDQATAHQPDPAPAGVAGGMGRRRAGQGGADRGPHARRSPVYRPACRADAGRCGAPPAGRHAAQHDQGRRAGADGFQP